MEKQVVISHVRARSIGRLVGVVNAIFALAAGIISSIVTIAAVISSQDYGFWGGLGMSAAILATAIIAIPLVAYAFGWLYGALIGFIWNVLLSTTGGIEVTTQEVPAVSKK